MAPPLAARVSELEQARIPFVQATVVRALHPTSAHAGDTALVHADGQIEGFVGGTCAESSVRVHALQVLVTGEPLLLRIQAGAPETRLEEGAVTVANPCLSGGTVEIFLEPRRPAPRMLVVGDTPVAQALVALGQPLGLAVERASGLPAGDDPGAGVAAVVVASHGRGEEPALEAALRADVLHRARREPDPGRSRAGLAQRPGHRPGAQPGRARHRRPERTGDRAVDPR